MIVVTCLELAAAYADIRGTYRGLIYDITDSIKMSVCNSQYVHKRHIGLDECQQNINYDKGNTISTSLLCLQALTGSFLLC